MTDLVLHTLNAGSKSGHLSAGHFTARCALGRSGKSHDRREGDGATPCGIFPLRFVLYRPDRVIRPLSGLPVKPTEPLQGWCDAPDDVCYNQPVTLPYRASAEHMWRNDTLYDIVIVPGFNDQPVIPGRGSAVFIHIATDDYAPTQGCIALSRQDISRILPGLSPVSKLVI